MKLTPPRDHGAMQLTSFGALPPRRPITSPLPNIDVPGGCYIQTEDEGRNYILTPIGIDGRPHSQVTGADYLTGLKALAHGDTLVKNMIVKKSEFSLASNGAAMIRFKTPQPAFESLLSSPAWIPVNKSFASGHWPGRRQLRELVPNRWEAFCPKGKNSAIIIETLRDPEENIRLFEAGILQQTADTATPIHAPLPGRGKRIARKTSLRAILVFSGDLASNKQMAIRKKIVNALKIVGCGEYVGWAKVSSPEDDPEPMNNRRLFNSVNLARSGIHLAYDDYYPNATVAWALAATLQDIGIFCTPVADSYTNPVVKAPVRLMIVAGPTDDSWGRYAALSLCPAWRRNRTAGQAYIETLGEPVFGKAAQNKLNSLIEEIAPFAMIGAIPSVCFSAKETQQLERLPIDYLGK